MVSFYWFCPSLLKYSSEIRLEMRSQKISTLFLGTFLIRFASAWLQIKTVYEIEHLELSIIRFNCSSWITQHFIAESAGIEKSDIYEFILENFRIIFDCVLSDGSGSLWIYPIQAYQHRHWLSLIAFWYSFPSVPMMN